MNNKLIIWAVMIQVIINIVIVNIVIDSEANETFTIQLPIYSTRSEPSSRSNNYTWGQIQVISEPIFDQDNNTGDSKSQRIAVEGDKIYVVWRDNTNFSGSGGDYDIFFRYFNGLAWSEIQVISEPILGNNINTGSGGECAIAVENGKIYVVWMDDNNTNSCGSDGDIFFRCNITGQGWEDVQVISEPTFGGNSNTGTSMYPQLDVENGNIYVIWADNTDLQNSGTDQDLFFRCKPTASGWGPIEVPNEPVTGKNLNIDNLGTMRGNIAVENGDVHIVWSDKNNTEGSGTDTDVFYRSKITGKGWGDISPISEPIFGQDSNKDESWAPDIDVDNGEIYIIWRGYAPELGAGNDRDIFLRCNITGNNWEDIFVVSEPVQGQNTNKDMSNLLDDGLKVDNGNIYVTWDDRNNTNNAGNEMETFFRCYLNNRGWEPVKVISEPMEGQNNMSQNSLNANIAFDLGKCHIVWRSKNDYNSSGTDMDIFYRSIQPPISPLFLRFATTTPATGNTSTEFDFKIRYYHLDNTPPAQIYMYLDETQLEPAETNQSDTKYSDGKEYYCMVSNLELGSHEYYFFATDGTITTKTRYYNKPLVNNTKPKIITQNNLTAIEDTYYEYSYEFIDMDIDKVGQDYTWEFETNASWLEFSTDLGTKSCTLSGTPTNDDVGIFSVDLMINDTMEFDQRKFSITVLDVNDKPDIITDNVLTTNEDELYKVIYEATDIDSSIEFQLWSLETNAIDWLSMNSSSGELRGKPCNDDVGFYWANVTVDDSKGGYDHTNFTLEVINVNDPPEIGTNDLLSATTGQMYEMDYDADDVDSNISDQRWSLETKESWLTIDEFSGLLYGIPPHSTEPGRTTINITVTDGDGGMDWHEINLLVVKGNEAPNIINTDTLNAKVNETYQTDYEALDDLTPYHFLVWGLKTNATWLSIDPSTGILSGIPSSSDGERSFWVNISVSDGNYGWDFHNFTITVHPEILIENDKPRLLNFRITPNEGNTKTYFTFSVHYTDSDSDPLSFIKVVIDGNEYDMKLETGGKPHNGIYLYMTILTEGEHTYYFTASDGTDTVISDEFNTPNIDEQQIEDDDEEEVNILMIGLIVIAIVIVILTTLFLILRRRKKKEDESRELDKIQLGMVPVPNIYPAVITQNVPFQPQPMQYQIQAPLIPPTQTLPYDTTQDYSTIGQPQQIESEQSRELIEETPEQQEIEYPVKVEVEELEQPEAEVMQGNEELIEE